MENFKSVLISLIILSALALLGFWAFTNLESGSTHEYRQQIKELENKNKDLEKEVANLSERLEELEPESGEEEEETPKQDTAQPVYKYQTLISELEQLIADNIVMKEKSRGSRVGTIQNFLNLYNNTQKRVDNDYGKTTKADVIAFQKAVGLTATGETNKDTYLKMIEWLKNQ
jgi:peptidoglycan hydrolase CwlO-like protein